MCIYVNIYNESCCISITIYNMCVYIYISFSIIMGNISVDCDSFPLYSLEHITMITIVCVSTIIHITIIEHTFRYSFDACYS